MKTYNQLITELNKFEKMMIQKGLKQIRVILYLKEL